jgi:hypothetical protein
MRGAIEMRVIPVQKVPIPANSFVAGVFSRVDYGDAYRVKLPSAGPCNIDTIARAIFSTAPRWVALLLRLRDRLVGLIGLKTAPRNAPIDLAHASLQPGESVGLFKVYQRSEDEILMGEDDRHLDFRVSVLLQVQHDQRWAVITTVVQFNNWLGRAYFLPVRPLHRLIVPAMMRNAVRRHRML